MFLFAHDAQNVSPIKATLIIMLPPPCFILGTVFWPKHEMEEEKEVYSQLQQEKHKRGRLLVAQMFPLKKLLMPSCNTHDTAVWIKRWSACRLKVSSFCSSSFFQRYNESEEESVGMRGEFSNSWSFLFVLRRTCMKIRCRGKNVYLRLLVLKLWGYLFCKTKPRRSPNGAATV